MKEKVDEESLKVGHMTAQRGPNWGAKEKVMPGNNYDNDITLWIR